MCRDKTKCEAGRICGADRHCSVLITWQIRIVTFSSRSAILTLTLALITDPQIRNLSPFRSAPKIRPAPHFTLTIYYLHFHLLNLAPANLQQCANPLRDMHYETHMHHARTYFINICHIIFTYMSNLCQCMWTMCNVLSMYVTLYDDYETVYVHIICHYISRAWFAKGPLSSYIAVIASRFLSYHFIHYSVPLIQLGILVSSSIVISLSLTKYHLSKSCYYHFRELCSIRPYLDFRSASTIATSTVHSKLY